MISDRFTYAAELATSFAQDKEAVFESLNLWIGWWRDILLVKQDCKDLVINIDRIDTLTKLADEYDVDQIAGFVKSLDSTVYNLGRNANPRLVFEVLMLNIPRIDHGRRKKETATVTF